MKKSGLTETILFGLLGITIIFTICANAGIQEQIDQLKQPQVVEITKVEPVQVDVALVERLEEIIRENVVLRQTVADQATQILEFGWLKSAMDREGVNP